MRLGNQVRAAAGFQRLTLDKPLGQGDIISTRCGVRPLAIKSDQASDRDSLQLSRKHVVDTNADSAHISIFGGKLTDCLNVGDEIAEAVAELGVALPDQGFRWYGEPPNAVKQQFMDHAKHMNLDAIGNHFVNAHLSYYHPTLKAPSRRPSGGFHDSPG
ncbi:MAG: hypothetical protein ACQERP_03580 [Pseudomonadota bacterium]